MTTEWSTVVLDFWFGTPDSPTYGKQQKRWFQSTPDLDLEITTRFSAYLEKAKTGKLEDTTLTPLDTLALIIVLDQFSRNIYRGKAEAFEADPLARKIAREAIDKNFDQRLPSFMKAFLYLPFEHSEDLTDQKHSVALFETLGDPLSLQYAIEHLETIQRFGRFPHRNKALERKSTIAENTFLKRV